MHVVIDRLAEFLASSPDSVLTENSIGAKCPSTVADIPGIAVSLHIDEQSGFGYGRFLREAQIAQNRGETQGARYQGLLTLEIWSNNLNVAEELCRKVQEKVFRNQELLRQKGFQSLRLAGLAPVEHVLRSPPIGSSFPVFHQELEYRFALEAQKVEEFGEGGPIRRIDVNLDEQLKESFSIPRPNGS